MGGAREVKQQASGIFGQKAKSHKSPPTGEPTDVLQSRSDECFEERIEGIIIDLFAIEGVGVRLLLSWITVLRRQQISAFTFR